MNIEEAISKLTSGNVPVGVMVTAGVLVLFVTLKIAKTLFKIVLVLAALALLGGALWLYLHRS